jgi:L-2-hydroxyglutarate oxidase
MTALAIPHDCDYLIIGAGIIGLAIAHKLKVKQPDAQICIIEKESSVAFHASGRNSGVLHAGFYYTSDSLKARLCVAGNKAMRSYCKSKGLPLNENGKLVVATTPEQITQLEELARRGKANGAEVELISAMEAQKLEPNVYTIEKALWSPNTATGDPAAVAQSLLVDVQGLGVKTLFNCKYIRGEEGTVQTSRGTINAKFVINCAGLYADRIARDFGFSKNFTIIPFKGLYLKYAKNKVDVTRNIYPVPDLRFPFLGVHFTKTVDGTIKIGPTAIPAFWRENYTLTSGFSANEFIEILFREAKLFTTNAFGFRTLAFEEMKKYSRGYFIGLAKKLIPSIDPNGFGEFTPPGIRAQLLDVRTQKLVQDFVVEGDKRSVHILNAVSPGWTCSFPFADMVVRDYLLR